MILYNVTLKVENDTAASWIEWMKDEHIPDVLGTGLFVNCRIMRLLEQDETDGTTYSVQWICPSMAQYNKYIEDHAIKMRTKTQNKFGNRLVAFRTVMEEILTIDAAN